MNMKDLSDKKLLQATFEEVGKIKEQLTVINGRFGKIDQRFEKIDDQFEKQDTKLDKILAVVTTNFSSHEKRIRRIEKHLDLPTLN